MLFAKPLPFAEALGSQAVRRLLPTDFTSGQLADLGPALLRRAQFSATVTDLGHLDELAGTYQEMLAGTLDRATARLRIKDYLARKGYTPSADKAGTLQDLSSDARINLQLDTNVEMMQGLGNQLQGQEPAVLDMYPARELVRVTSAEKPRDWETRWDEARAATTAEGATESASGRMIALVGHPIWKELSAFGNDYPPFDYNSGMGLRDISRREAMSLDLIGRDTQVVPSTDAPRPDRNVQTSSAVRDPRLKAALEKTGLGTFDAAGIFRLTPTDGGAS